MLVRLAAIARPLAIAAVIRHRARMPHDTALIATVAGALAVPRSSGKHCAERAPMRLPVAMLLLLLAAPALGHHASDSYVAIFAKEPDGGWFHKLELDSGQFQLGIGYPF